VDAYSLIARERERLAALVARDMATCDRLHAEEYQLITPNGSAMSKAMYLGSILGGSLRYRVFEPIEEPRVLMSGGMAVLRYRCRIEVLSEGEHFIAHAWHTDIWREIDGEWTAFWSQATAYPS
jgi:hypothetical protein